jgi:hypothetical protein
MTEDPLRYFIAFTLEWFCYLVYFLAMLLWIRIDRRGILKVMAGYYVISSLILIGITLARGTAEGNIHLYSILSVFTAFALGAYFYNLLSSKSGKIAVLICCLLNGAYYLVTNLLQNGHVVFPSMAYVLLSVSVVFLSLWFMVQLMRNVTEEPLAMNQDFWFVAAQLIYFAGAFAIFLTFEYLTKKAINGEGYVGSSRSLTWLWGIHNVLLFLSALLTLAGVLWISYRKRSR